MADARSSWNEAGEKLGELGRKLKVQYEAQHGEAQHGETQHGETQHGETQRGEAQGPSREELAAAARRVGGAVQDAFEALSTAARDKAVQDDVKQVGKSVVDALGATFGQVSEELRRAFSERKGPAQGRSADPTASEPPAPGATTDAATDATPAGPAGEGDEGGTPPKVEPWGTP